MIYCFFIHSLFVAVLVRVKKYFSLSSTNSNDVTSLVLSVKQFFVIIYDFGNAIQALG